MALVPWIALGGALGAVARFGVTVWAAVLDVGASPSLGDLGGQRDRFSPVSEDSSRGATWSARAGFSPGSRACCFTTGVMGAFTTFSTFSVETLRLLDSVENVAWAAANVLGNVVLSLGAAAVGMAMVRGLWAGGPS